MADAGAEQWRPEVEEVAETAVKHITTVDVTDILNFDDNVDGTTNTKDEILYDTSASHVETGQSSNVVGEVVEEEIVELEFEKVKPKLATHSMHCPNCKSEITKVILRRKVVSYRPTQQVPVAQVEPEPEQRDIVGCFSCLSLFTCSDNGCFNPFDIFRGRPETSIDHASSSGDEQKLKPVIRENESCFSMFWVVGKQQNDLKPVDPPQADPVLYVNRQSIITSNQVQAPEHDTLKLEELQQPEPLYVNRQSIISSHQTQAPKYVSGSDLKLKEPQLAEPMYVNRQSIIPKGTFRLLSSDLPESSNATGDNDTMITFENEPETIAVVAQSRGRAWLGYDGVLVEILKSIVYGGLMEVIASLSVVASAAASDAATLSIVSLALASLIGGVFIIGHNLWDLRDDCYKDTSSQETNKAATEKYKELLGQVNYFPLHAFFAILSFLVFGMVPPVAYGYSFYETSDKDFTLVVTATASLLCVLLLAMLKAYINKCTVFKYFKTVVYYIIIAISLSGVSYVVGHLVARLMEDLGWFNTSSGDDMPCLPRVTNPYLESF